MKYPRSIRPQRLEHARRACAAPFPFVHYRSLRFGQRPSCPRCRSTVVRRWGGFSGRRRYRCGGCSRTFSDFTATPLAYLKRVEKWPRHCESALRKESLRHEAELLGVHRSTTFRWRHRLMEALDHVDRAALAGVIAVRETPFHRSEKGSRKLRRTARRKGWPKDIRAFQAPAVWVIVALAQDGRVATGVASSRPTDKDYRRLLAARLGSRARITSRNGPFGAPALFARRQRLAHDDGRRRHEENNAASGYVSNLRGWLRRFHGVASKYLPNYLVWHRFLHALRVKRCGLGPRRLLTVKFP